MGRTEKLLEKARRRSRLSFREFEALIEAHGFALRNTSGSHRNWKHQPTGKVLSVQSDGPDAKPYQVRQFLAIIDSTFEDPSSP